MDSNDFPFPEVKIKVPIIVISTVIILFVLKSVVCFVEYVCTWIVKKKNHISPVPNIASISHEVLDFVSVE